jgi:hypothetical protein
MQTDFAGSQFPNDESRDGSQNTGLFTVTLFNTADGPGTFYPDCFIFIFGYYGTVVRTKRFNSSLHMLLQQTYAENVHIAKHRHNLANNSRGGKVDQGY